MSLNKIHGFGTNGGVLVSSSGKKSREEVEQIQKGKGLLKTGRQVKGRGQELDASRLPTLTEGMAPLSAAGVWLTERWVSSCRCRVDLSVLQPLADIDWLRHKHFGLGSTRWGKPSSYLGETQEVTEGHAYSSKRVSACLRLNDSVILTGVQERPGVDI